MGTCLVAAAFLAWNGPFSPPQGADLKWANPDLRGDIVDGVAAVVLLGCAYGFHRSVRWTAYAAATCVALAVGFGLASGDGGSLDLNVDSMFSFGLELFMVTLGLTAGWFGCRGVAAEPELRAP